MKLCVDCGEEPKKAGHPKWCTDCWTIRQPMAHQVAGCQIARSTSSATAKRPLRAEWPAGTKWCSGCRRFRREDFFARSATKCRPCVSERAHASRTERTYGVTPDEYAAMSDRQGGRCAVCQKRQVRQRLAVHHDHRDGHVIALLCSRCNHDVIGRAYDSAWILLRAYALQSGGLDAVERVNTMTELPRL